MTRNRIYLLIFGVLELIMVFAFQDGIENAALAILVLGSVVSVWLVYFRLRYKRLPKDPRDKGQPGYKSSGIGIWKWLE